jgi:hypothetical protein
MRPILLLGMIACSATVEDTTGPPQHQTDTTLPLPDISGIDFQAAYRDALSLSLGVVGGVPFDTHTTLLAERELTCPDVYAGIPDDSIDDLDEDMGGASWWDFCETGGGQLWAGYSWWDSDAQINGTSADIGGVTADGLRSLIADATVRRDNAPEWEFDGSLEESLHHTYGTGFDDFTWSSTLDATFTGTRAFDAHPDTPEGWRSDLYLFSQGGAVDSLEARGNVYLFQPVLHDRFDSIVMDLEIQGAAGAPPDTCLAEPLGWIGLRDADAIWYDLIFLPRTGNDVVDAPWENPLSNCDGCGTLYVRGVESGEVCVDLSFVLSDFIEPPDIDDFVLPLRGLP